MKKEHVSLSEKERQDLKILTTKGELPARMFKRATALLALDRGETLAAVAKLLNVGTNTVRGWKKRFEEEGMEGLHDKPCSGRPVEIDGEQRAKITALACSKPPEGYGAWTLRMLADKAVELDYCESISHTHIGNILQNNELKPHQKKTWCIGTINAQFIARMEQILWLYRLPYDPKYPVICFDERPCFLIGEAVAPLAMQPGQLKKEHYAYEKLGSCSLLAAIEPLTGKRIAQVYEQRTKKEFTDFCQSLADAYPDAKQIRLVLDNLNTHTYEAFYDCLPADKARALVDRFDFYYTPKSASWLNMIEIEFSAVAGLCLNRRIDNIDTLTTEVLSFLRQRSDKRVKINWQFSIENARSKLNSHYQKLHPDNEKFRDQKHSKT